MLEHTGSKVHVVSRAFPSSLRQSPFRFQLGACCCTLVPCFYCHRQCSGITLAASRTLQMSLGMCLEKTIGLLDLEYLDDNGWRCTAWTCSACNRAVRAVVVANDAELLCHIWSSSAQLIPFHHWAQKWLMLMRLARSKVFNVHIIDDDNENFLDILERSNYVTFRALRFSRLVMDTTPSPTPRD